MSTDEGSILPALVLNEPFRPQFHFTPQKGWLNDPNGLVFYDGEYHLFYQFYPDDTIWGPMHWGHAISKDLVNWQHLPTALYPDELGYIFSGSAVIDWHNTAGFGKEAMVLFFTHHHPETLEQSQSLAYSLDNGRSFSLYPHNPIIPTQENLQDFRDPKVIWYEAEDGAGHWVMSLAANDQILFYISNNLIDWQENGRFTHPQSAATGLWETPDLFQLPVTGRGESRWVLTIGIDNRAPGGKSGTQYFIGEFDGTTFTCNQSRDCVFWADFGADFYAAQSWSDTPDGRRLWLAWMNNWRYAYNIPTSTWRGGLSIPREVRLVETEAGIRLVQKPVPELQMLRNGRYLWKDVSIQPDHPVHLIAKSNLLEIVAEFENGADADTFGIRVLTNDTNATTVDATTIGYNPQNQCLYTDRSQSGQVDFHEEFPIIHQAKLPLTDESLRLHIFVDHSMVEVFANEGLVCFSERVFPAEGNVGIEIFSEGASVNLKMLEVFEMKTAVFTQAPYPKQPSKVAQQT